LEDIKTPSPLKRIAKFMMREAFDGLQRVLTDELYTHLEGTQNKNKRRCDEMFDYDRTLELLEDFGDLSAKKSRKFLKGLFMDETFMEWLFQPKQVPNINELVGALYVEFTKPKVIKGISDMLEDVGQREFTRTHATFIYSICNIAIQGNNEKMIDIDKQRKAGDIGNKEAQRLNEKIEVFNSYIARLLKNAKKIIKREAEEISKESRLPKYVCITALHSIPEYKYVDRFKIGFYLNNLLNSIYSEIEQMGGFPQNVRWRAFFKSIFGKDNVVEVATFVLLEGVHRIDKYSNSRDVKEAWDSLTSFALRELDDAPEAIRTQMVELYIKRIDKMFSNKAFDLRVDLMSVNTKLFPKLVETVEKYADKIETILIRGKE